MAGTVHLIKGDDRSLVSQALSSLLDDLIGDGERPLMLDEVGEDVMLAGDEPDPSALVTAAMTPPFLTDKRVVVGRHMGVFTRAALVEPLVAYLADPSPTTDLVLVWEKPVVSGSKVGAIPKSLKDAVAAAGGNIIEGAPKRALKQLLDQKLNQAPVMLDSSARQAITDNLGDDVGQAEPLIDLLVSTYGLGARIGRDEVEPFLGQASDVAPWDLTDAIDDGDIARALDMAHRMLHGGERHPLQILFTLHNHYQRCLALDGSGVANERAAADLLGIKGSPFPAKKALTLSRRLGGARVKRCIELLAQADLDLRGGTGLNDEVVVEVLVARLANTSRA